MDFRRITWVIKMTLFSNRLNPKFREDEYDDGSKLETSNSQRRNFARH